MPDTVPHVAISVGHRRNAQGARGQGMTEGLYNSELSKDLKASLAKRGIESEIVLRPEGRDEQGTSPYLQQIALVNATKALVAVDLHLNAAENRWARGRLWLSSGSRGSLELAGYLQKAMNARVPASNDVGAPTPVNDRGVQVRPVEENGGPFLHLTNMPAVINEPWFVTNPIDRMDLVWYRDRYIESMCDGLENYFRAIGAIE